MKHDRICGSRCLGPMTFHTEMTGKYVTISHGGRLASRDASSFMDGLAFLSRAIKFDEKICIQIESCSSRWDGALRVGFTNIRPNKRCIPASSIPELSDTPGYCVLPVPVDLCVHSAEIHFWMNYAGMILVEGITRERYYIKAKGLNLNKSLWVFIDLYGNTSTVRLLGSRRGSRTSCPDIASGINCLVETRSVQKTSWSPSVFLLRHANQKTVPSPTECSELTQAGLGIPDHESERGVDLNWTWREMHHFICSSYPSVGLDWIGFSAVKADKNGRLCRINPKTMNKLKKELGESVLYIIPDKDIVLNEMPTHTLSSVINRNASSPSRSAPSVPAQRRQRLTSSTSYMSCSSPNSSMEDIDVGSLLREFQQNHLSGSEQVSILVNRNRLLQSAKNAVSNYNFSWTKIPLVKFVGEEAIDCGGPRREFLRLLMMEVQSSLGIFEGKPGHLFFTYDQMALEQHKYELAGKLIAWSVAHGGPGFKALDPCLYQLMCIQECPLADFNWRLIPDADIQNKLQRILSCKRTTDLHRLQREEGDWICECGVPGIYRPDISIRDIPQIYSYAIRHYIYLRTSKMIHQFTEGLNAYGQFWDMVKSYWAEFLPIFTNTHEPITRSSFRALFQIHWSKAMKREPEEETIHSWELVLKMIEDKKTELRFEELLAFITGADQVPPLGFPQKPSIHFYQPEKRGCRLPYANTCMMRLCLPSGVKNEAELHRMLLRAIKDSADFGRT
ncbi:uncharacterized protein LOC130568108 isoform X2 [Triplophysa rosa]|uniref:uncharacterized protein LOC130568108 isoform X2 n=1 Tax=Triplophysa rosa TaxID=992332 RepID=UPI0025462850|nr:uncharacterized protein LOC130568108 isoform X2 [Triplophysa rosa]